MRMVIGIVLCKVKYVNGNVNFDQMFETFT